MLDNLHNTTFICWLIALLSLAAAFIIWAWRTRCQLKHLNRRIVIMGARVDNRITMLAASEDGHIQALSQNMTNTMQRIETFCVCEQTLLGK